MSRNPAAEGFPWERVRAAQRYLHTLRPWWNRFGARTTIVPISVPAPPGRPYGGLTSTDGRMRLYVDRGFAINAPIPLLAGALEHEYRHHVHDSWRRLSWLSPGEWRRWANICLDLEINSVMEGDAGNLPMSAVETICARSGTFGREELRRWMIDSPPGLGDLGWTPEALNLPPRMSAEEYLRLLEERSPEGEGGSGDGDSEEDGGGDSGSGGAGDRAAGEGAPEAGGCGDGDRGRDSAEEPAPPEPGAGDSGGEPPREPGAGAGEWDSEEDTGADGAGAGDARGGDSDTGGSDPGGGGDSAGTSTSGGDGADSGPAGATPAEAAERLRNSSVAHSWWSRECNRPGDSEPSWMPPEDTRGDGAESGETERALRELAQDVEDARGRTRFGTAPGPGMLNWSGRVMRAAKMDWQSVLTRMLSSAVDSARISGASDLSFAVRNPHVTTPGPVLPGIHARAPRIVAVQDVSGSMTTAMERSGAAFRSLVESVAGRYGEPVTWITVDTKVRAVGRSVTLTPELLRQWQSGGGGTVMKATLEQLARGRLRWRRSVLPRPDVLVVFTDCAFSWPWHDRSLTSPQLVVASVRTHQEAEHHLPEWIRPGRQFVHVPA